MRSHGKRAVFAIRIAAPVIFAMGLGAVPAGAQSLVEYVKQSCNTELTTYCNQVTPGENRLLACIYAHGDKLSGQCEKALYDAAAALERAINTIAYVANQCRADIESKCATIQPGQGRIAQCLADNKSSLSAPCTQAMTEVGAM
jgi:Cysteine rich repeat